MVLTKIKVADEVFIATALLHRENPGRADFSDREIIERVRAENLSGTLRPGVATHVSVHAVANKKPNPGNYRMLYATRDGRRRLLRSSDDVNPQRTGKIFPDPEDVPPQYSQLIEWARNRYGSETTPAVRWLDGILQLRGTGRDLWKGEDPDEYVRKLRESWE